MARLSDFQTLMDKHTVSAGEAAYTGFWKWFYGASNAEVTNYALPSQRHFVNWRLYEVEAWVTVDTGEHKQAVSLWICALGDLTTTPSITLCGGWQGFNHHVGRVWPDGMPAPYGIGTLIYKGGVAANEQVHTRALYRRVLE